jgi:hypothetical protein
VAGAVVAGARLVEAAPTRRAKALSRATPSGVRGRSSRRPVAVDDVRGVLRPRDGDVETVLQQKELEAARGIATRRRGERHDRDRRLLPWNLSTVPTGTRSKPAAVSASSTVTCCALYGVTTMRSLCASGARHPLPASTPPDEVAHQRDDDRGLLRRRRGVAGVAERHGHARLDAVETAR